MVDEKDWKKKILREFLKGMLREVVAYFFRKNFRETRKPPAVTSKRVVHKNIKQQLPP